LSRDIDSMVYTWAAGRGRFSSRWELEVATTCSLEGRRRAGVTVMTAGAAVRKDCDGCGGTEVVVKGSIISVSTLDLWRAWCDLTHTSAFFQEGDCEARVSVSEWGSRTTNIPPWGSTCDCDWASRRPDLSLRLRRYSRRQRIKRMMNPSSTAAAAKVNPAMTAG
jgi:hypothetical protein